MIGIEQFGRAARRQTGTAARPTDRCTEQVQVRPDVCEREPAHLDQPEETFGADQAVFLVQVAYVSAGGDEHDMESKNSGPCSRSYTKSRALMPCYEGGLHALFG